MPTPVKKRSSASMNSEPAKARQQRGDAEDREAGEQQRPAAEAVADRPRRQRADHDADARPQKGRREGRPRQVPGMGQRRHRHADRVDVVAVADLHQRAQRGDPELQAARAAGFPAPSRPPMTPSAIHLPRSCAGFLPRHPCCISAPAAQASTPIAVSRWSFADDHPPARRDRHVARRGRHPGADRRSRRVRAQSAPPRRAGRRAAACGCGRTPRPTNARSSR